MHIHHSGPARYWVALLCLCGLTLSLGQTAHAQSITFTSPTTILKSNTKYENYDVTVSNTTVTIDGAHTFHSLTLTSSGVVTHDPKSSANYAGGLNLTITTNVTIPSGCSISADGQGFGSGAGPGAGANDKSGSGSGTGGSFGGQGAGGGTCYGDIKNPIDLGNGENLGSGGGSGSGGKFLGGAGGGAVQLTIGGTLQVDGVLSAQGVSGAGNNPGAGSGGSLLLNVGTLKGAGTISANGGFAGAGFTGTVHGGGGRIAIYYGANSFSGSITAVGGAGNYDSNAGAGTIFKKQTSASQGDLLVGHLPHNRVMV